MGLQPPTRVEMEGVADFEPPVVPSGHKQPRHERLVLSVWPTGLGQGNGAKKSLCT